MLNREVKNILILLGKTCSGKTTIQNELVNNGFNKIIKYTTRPIRKGEGQNVTYHYMSEEDFKKKIDKGAFAEWKSYASVEGVWYYGSALEDYINADDNSVIILTPEGYKDVIDILDDKAKVIYIYANNATMKKRLLERGDNVKEAERRVLKDNEDFKGVENLVDRIIYNNYDNDLENVIKTVIHYAKGEGNIKNDAKER